jgi:hypothetical protein
MSNAIGRSDVGDTTDPPPEIQIYFQAGPNDSNG